LTRNNQNKRSAEGCEQMRSIDAELLLERKKERKRKRERERGRKKEKTRKRG
jgi:hypothetical protein